jgi:hypothetical protein
MVLGERGELEQYELSALPVLKMAIRDEKG